MRLLKANALLLLLCVLLSACSGKPTQQASPQRAQKEEILFPMVDTNQRCGYINSTGRIVIKPQFSKADNFSEGLAAVAVGDKWGFINKTGEFVINPQFEPLKKPEYGEEKAPSFKEGVALIKSNDKYGFIDRTGKFVIPLQFDLAFPFSEGLACVGYSQGEEGYKVGYINKVGKFVISPVFELRYTSNDQNPNFHNGLATAALKVKDGYDLGYINPKGVFIWKMPIKLNTLKSFED